MNKHELAYVYAIVDQARGADMDVGLSVNVLATLLTAYERAAAERDEAMAACEAAAIWFSGSVLSAQEQHIVGLLRAAIAKAGAR